MIYNDDIKMLATHSVNFWEVSFWANTFLIEPFLILIQQTSTCPKAPARIVNSRAFTIAAQTKKKVKIMFPISLSTSFYF